MPECVVPQRLSQGLDRVRDLNFKASTMTWPDSQESRSEEPRRGQRQSDHSLVRRLRRGSEDAATKLYVRYARRLMAVARSKSSRDLATRVDAEEIVQSVFRTFFRRAARGCYDVPPGDDLWNLLLVIALNKVRKAGEFHRAAKRDVRLTIGSNSVDWSKQPFSGPDDLALTHLEMVVEDLLSTLTPQQRSIMEMRIEGFEVAEIAQKSGRSKRTVERILQECRQRLDFWLHEDD